MTTRWAIQPYHPKECPVWNRTETDRNRTVFRFFPDEPVLWRRTERGRSRNSQAGRLPARPGQFPVSRKGAAGGECGGLWATWVWGSNFGNRLISDRQQRFSVVEFKDLADQGANQAGRVRRAAPKAGAGPKPRGDTMRHAGARPLTGFGAIHRTVSSAELVTHASPVRLGGFHRRGRVRRRH